MSERADGDRRPRKPAPEARFRRPAAELIAREARRAVRAERASFPSLAAFRSAVLSGLRRDEPLATVGGARLRRLLTEVAGVRMSVRYSERPSAPPPVHCPVCGSDLEPIRNRTLTGQTVVLGKRCSKCAYWTHGARRVPVRYTISRGEARPRGKRSQTA